MTTRIPLGEICDFTYGDSLIEEKRQPGKVPVFGSNGIVGWHDKATTGGPTIVIGRKGSIGEVNWSDVPCYPIDTTYFVEKTKRPCELKWLYFGLRQLDLTRLNKSAAVPGLNRDDAYEQRISYPDVPAQRRIAGVLEQADRLRRTRRYALELSNTFLPAAFRELFGEWQVAAPKYEVKLLEGLVQPDRGVTYGIVQAGPNVPMGVPYIRTGDIIDGEIRQEELLRTTREIADSYQRSEVKFGDLVVSIRATVGTIGLLPKELDGANLTQGTARIAPGPQLEKHFLLWQIRSAEAQRWISQQVKGSTFLEITLGRLREMPIFVPPLPKQQHFAALVARHERLRARQREALRQAEHLFQSLLHRAFTTGL